MGQVFTFGQIKTRHLPELDDFTHVLQQLRNVLTRESSFVGAVVCGSVIRGDHNRRSDIDCAVVYRAEESRKAFAVMQELSVYAQRYYVPLTFIQSDTRLARTRMHHFGPSFVEHLRRSMEKGGNIKGVMLDMFAASVDRHSAAEEYLRYKMHYLQTHWAAYPALDHKDKAEFLKKCLEAPLHVARKTLSWLGPLTVDSKLHIRQQYSTCMPEGMVSILGELVNVDVEYSLELERQIKEPDEEDYEIMLRYLEEQVPQVLEFVTRNLEFINGAAR